MFSISAIVCLTKNAVHGGAGDAKQSRGGRLFVPRLGHRATHVIDRERRFGLSRRGEKREVIDTVIEREQHRALGFNEEAMDGPVELAEVVWPCRSRERGHELLVNLRWTGVPACFRVMRDTLDNQ